MCDVDMTSSPNASLASASETVRRTAWLEGSRIPGSDSIVLYRGPKPAPGLPTAPGGMASAVQLGWDGHNLRKCTHVLHPPHVPHGCLRPRSRHAPGRVNDSRANNRIRVGVIGTGGRARGLMNQLKKLPACELTAVCDVYEPRILQAAEIAGVRQSRSATTAASWTIAESMAW